MTLSATFPGAGGGNNNKAEGWKCTAYFQYNLQLRSSSNKLYTSIVTQDNSSGSLSTDSQSQIHSVGSFYKK